MRKQLTAIIPALALGALLSLVLHRGPPDDSDARGPDRWDKLLVEGRRRILNEYVEDIDEEVLYQGAIDGMLEALDPYSQYIHQEDVLAFDQSFDGKYGGVGIIIEKSSQGLEVVSPMVDTPAFRAGIMPGDQVVAVDGFPLAEASINEAIHRIKGPMGTSVQLTVLPIRSGESTRIVTLERAEIPLQSVRGSTVIDSQAGIGFLRITAFQRNTPEEFDAALQPLLEAGIRGLIIDLRNNPGGSLRASAEIADRFVSSGVLVSTRGRNEAEEWPARSQNAIEDLPLMVLINAGSASASEIVGGALQDHRVAQLVGTRSYGKGSVQRTWDLGDGKLKLTVAHYFTPNGRLLHKTEAAAEAGTWGLEPDIVVELSEEEERARIEAVSREELERTKAAATGDPGPEPFLDRQLQAALDALRARLAAETP